MADARSIPPDLLREVIREVNHRLLRGPVDHNEFTAALLHCTPEPGNRLHVPRVAHRADAQPPMAGSGVGCGQRTTQQDPRVRLKCGQQCRLVGQTQVLSEPE